MSWTQLMAAWGMDIGLSAPVAGTLGVVGPVALGVVACCGVLGGLEAWAAHMRREAGRVKGGQRGSKAASAAKRNG